MANEPIEKGARIMTVQNYTDLEHSKMIQDIMKDVETEKAWVRWDEEQAGDPIYETPDGFDLEPRYDVEYYMDCHGTDTTVYYSAFTLTEILSKLPSYIKHNGSRYRLTIMKFNDNLYDITYYNTGAIACVESSRDLMEQEDINHKGFEQRCPTNAAARLLKWVSDNEHMEE